MRRFVTLNGRPTVGLPDGSDVIALPAPRWDALRLQRVRDGSPVWTTGDLRIGVDPRAMHVGSDRSDHLAMYWAAGRAVAALGELAFVLLDADTGVTRVEAEPRFTYQASLDQAGFLETGDGRLVVVSTQRIFVVSASSPDVVSIDVPGLLASLPVISGADLEIELVDIESRTFAPRTFRIHI